MPDESIEAAIRFAWFGYQYSNDPISFTSYLANLIAASMDSSVHITK